MLIIPTLTDKVAIITGSARGIGKAIAIKLASEGAHIVISDVMEDEMNQTLEEIKKISPDSIAVKADVTNRADVQNMVKSAMDKW